jgi:hypothetical protein
MANLTVVYGGKTHQDAAKSVEAYLGFGAAIVAEGFNGRLGRYGAVISVPDQHLEWQAGRLQSGLIATKEADSAKAAADHLRDQFDVEVQQRLIGPITVSVEVTIDLAAYELNYGSRDDASAYADALVRDAAKTAFERVGGWASVK